MLRQVLRVLVLAAGVLLVGCPKRGPSLPESQFSRLGSTNIASVPESCQELTDFVFSADGKRVICTGWMADGNGHKAGVWVNDTILMRVDSVFELGFSPSNEPYFIAKDSGKAFIYYRYARPRAYEQVTAPSFSADGERLGCLTQNGGRQTLIIGDGETRSLSGVLDYAMAPTGDRFAYASADSDVYYVTEGKQVSDIYDWVQAMSYSADGTSLAYAAMADGQWFVVRNGTELDPFGDEVVDIADVILSQDGRHLAYVVAVLDSEEDEIYEYAMQDEVEGDVYLDISDLCFSPDGSKLAFIADDGEGPFVVSPLGEGANYDDIWGLSFTPNGDDIAYSARQGDEEFVVTGGTEHQADDQVDKVRFSRRGDRVGFGALQGRDFSWVVDPVR